MSMVIKIGDWIVKWQVKMIIISWEMWNDKWVESWSWGVESSGQEDETCGKWLEWKAK